MAIDWSLARGQGNAFAAALDGYQAGRAIAADQAKQRATENALAAQQTASTQAASGDFTGAQTTAIGSGQFDLAASIAKLDDQQRAHAVQQADDLASLGYSLKGLPYEQRKAALHSAAPTLLQRGLTAEQIAGFDPTDDNIATVVGSAMTLKEQIAAANAGASTLGPGQQRFDAQGRMIASVAPAPVRPVVVGQGAVALGPDGTPVFKNPKTYAPPRPGAAGSGVPPLPPGFVIEK